MKSYYLCIIMRCSEHGGSDGKDGGNGDVESGGTFCLIIFASEGSGDTEGVIDFSLIVFAVLAGSDLGVGGVQVSNAGSSGVLADECFGGAVLTLGGLGGDNGNEGGKSSEFHFNLFIYYKVLIIISFL